MLQMNIMFKKKKYINQHKMIHKKDWQKNKKKLKIKINWVVIIINKNNHK